MSYGTIKSMEKPTVHSNFVRNLYFLAGIIATLAYRIIVILNFYGAVLVQISWYIGTIGFIIYFFHRYQISEKRSKIINQHNLKEKVSQLQELNTEDKEAMAYIFATLQSSKEKWNNILIFAVSGIALAIGIYLDFIVKLFK